MTEPQNPSLEDVFDRALQLSGLSQNAAAKAAGITGPRWRQIVSGVEKKGGMQVPTRGPAETLARMASVVGVSAATLRRLGRPDAALALNRSVVSQQADDSEASDLLGGYDDLPSALESAVERQRNVNRSLARYAEIMERNATEARKLIEANAHNVTRLKNLAAAVGVELDRRGAELGDEEAEDDELARAAADHDEPAATDPDKL